MMTWLIAPVTATAQILSEKKEIQPFFGASFTIDGVSKPGVGVEMGLKAYFLYAAFEYGLYGSPVDPGDTFRTVDPVLPENDGLFEVYYAFDFGGVIFDKLF